MRRSRKIGPLLGGFMVFVAACVGLGVGVSADPVATPTPIGAFGEAVSATPLPGNLDQVVVIEDDQTYVIRQLLSRDGIRPIYDPQFIRPEDVNMSGDALVMGVTINGDARAYPVRILHSREMVNDVIGGTPVLVTW